MYDKITIMADTAFIINHLSMNGYSFEAIGQNLYVFEDETPYVEEILSEYNIRYGKNDKAYQLNTERGLVSIATWYRDAEEAEKDGYTYAFNAFKNDLTLFSKCLDERGLYHSFAIVG